MNSQKFYYGEDIIEKTRDYQLPTQITSIARSKSENRRLIKQITKTSNSPNSKSQLSGYNNITEYNQNTIGQDRIMKRRTLILQKELPNQDTSNGLLSSQTKIKIFKAPFKKIQTSIDKTQSFNNNNNHNYNNNKMQSHLESFDNEQQFINSLLQKDQKPERIDKLIKIRLAKSQMTIHSHQRSQQTEISIEKQKLPTQSSIRRESQRDQRDKKSVELKHHIYKLLLAFEDTCQIWKGKNKLENFLDNEQKFVGFMNFTYNLTNLPLNIEGLEQMFKGTKYVLKTLKPYIPQSLEKLIFEDQECQKFRQLTFQYQIFYILNNHSELIDTFTNQSIRFMVRQSKECIDLQHNIEKQFLNKNQNDMENIQSIFEKQFNQPYQTLLNEARSFCNLVIEYDYVKQLYCFCIKVQDALSQKIQQEANKKQVYEKGFDFKTALSKIKAKDINHEKLFAQLIPKKHEIIDKLDKFESKFGRIESISNMQREQAKLADMKHNQLYEKILKLQKQME
ncbi:unnamed protein product [Paramecium pentaurelia]|uniref:Uncharacterized protein n=1 Tax=Paramecium pentaurelia TaxID=43138 RepID=A0A8S1XQ06_9CILI|nr:unnamed protein product [Paramecium pentaurelia]